MPGGRFFRSYDGAAYTDKGFSATVSDFRLDKFEITVGRFRKFKAAWEAGWRPAAAAGKHSYLNGGVGLADSNGGGAMLYEDGWLDSWTANVAPTDANLQCDAAALDGGAPAAYQTWTPSPGANENRPVSCINWYEAYAFCIWDGGFLPSEAEWNYAAAGGTEQRTYPWSIPSTSMDIDCSYANFRSSDYCVEPGSGSTNDVGSESPKGDGKYGQADLGGNVWEWVLDRSAPYNATCTNCSSLPASGSGGVIRGGGLDSAAADALVSRRNFDVAPSGRSNGNLGARCARSPIGVLTKDVRLVADQNGHYDGSNAAGVVGYWWATGDDYGNDATPGGGTCRADGFPASACSVLTSPVPGQFFRPDASGRMCASGVAAKVIPDATNLPAYGAIWGDIIGFQLNAPGTVDNGVATIDVYDAPAHGIKGFAFDIDAVPTGGHLRVTFQTRGTEDNAAYWGGAAMDLSPIVSPGHYEIRWPEVGGPMYAPSPPPFDPTKLEAITFHVVSNGFDAVPFSFCLGNLTLLTH